MALLAPFFDEVVRMLGGVVDDLANQQRDQPKVDSLPRHANFVLGCCYITRCWSHMVMAEADFARLQPPQNQDNDSQGRHACRDDTPCNRHE